MAGIRDSKTVDGVTYNYLTLDGKVVRQTWGSNVLDIIYDNSGLPYAFKYNNAYYIYVLNQQGDVIRIVNSTGATVAEYRYDAWGNVIYSNGSLAAVNPIRYRGYYYDAETGFYYLQSRYYDPTIGRFINADSFASTGQDFAGYNMFSYCGNTPTSRKDTNGHFWLELLDEFTQAVRQANGYFVMAGGISQFDTPAIGPADVAAAGVAFLGILYCGGVALNNVLNTVSFSNSSAIGKKTIEEGLSGIANSYANYQCDKAKDSMVDYLTKNGKRGAIITIKFIGGIGYVMSNKENTVISETGFHVGVSYNGIVYCNVHPFGLPEAEWIADFEGTGVKCVLRTPF